MRVLKTKNFARWARKERLDDRSLVNAVGEIRRGLVDAQLGGGLVKKRVARSGSGKSGGFRTLLASNLHDRFVFLFGFAKNERDNVDDDELADLKRIARGYLTMSDESLHRALGTGMLQEIDDGETQAS